MGNLKCSLLSSLTREVRSGLGHWAVVLSVIIRTLFKVIINPSYLCFCVLAVGVGSLGLWISVFSGKEFLLAIRESGKESIFTFCVAMLGNMAVENYFKLKVRNGGEGKSDPHVFVAEHLAVLGWVAALVISMLVYFGVMQGWFYGLVATISMWVFYNSYNPVFEGYSKDAMESLIPAGDGQKTHKETEDNLESEIKGPGL